MIKVVLDTNILVSAFIYEGGNECNKQQTIPEKKTMSKTHESGHAGKTDIEHAVKKINPDILIPIHTQNPEEFKKIHDNVRIPERGGTIKVCGDAGG